jgi:hypothetical protein
MHLDSYTCENCILQRMETSYHLFLRCNFAKSCWASIGLTAPQIKCPLRATMRLKRQLNMAGSLELIILKAWSIWQCRNGWIFYNIAPTVERCRGIFLQEVKWLLLRLKPSTSQIIRLWLESFQLVLMFWFLVPVHTVSCFT